MVLTEAAVHHILEGHGEMEPHLDAILRAVERPTIHRVGRVTNEEWYSLRVPGLHDGARVVHFLDEAGSVTTAFGRSQLP